MYEYFTKNKEDFKAGLTALGFLVLMIGSQFIGIALYFKYFVRIEDAMNDVFTIIGFSYALTFIAVIFYMRRK